MRTAREKRLPVDPDTRRPKISDRREQCGLLTLVPPSARDSRDATRAAMLCSLLHSRHQQRVRTQLHEHRDTVLQQLRNSICEAHWLSHVAAPVRRIELGAAGHTRQHGRVNRHGGGRMRQSNELGRQAGRRPVHLRAVGSDVHLHQAAENSITLTLGQNLAHDDRVTRDHGRGRAVAYGNRYTDAPCSDAGFRIRHG